ncbi:MAG: transporter associated domain-containing protein, partial [Acholeplasmataceae bacterium]
EEIVGNIFDEYDEVEEEFVRIDDRHYEVDGLMNIDDLEDRLGIGLPVDDYDTLSGFILGFLGRIPDNGEGVAFTYNDHRFEVLKYEDQIIANVRITKLEGEKTDD